jgi:hypothetical protein
MNSHVSCGLFNDPLEHACEALKVSARVLRILDLGIRHRLSLTKHLHWGGLFWQRLLLRCLLSLYLWLCVHVPAHRFKLSLFHLS